MKRADVPPYIDVNGVRYDVLFSKDVSSIAGRKFKCRGYCDGESKKIYIQVGLDESLRGSTFWHEVLHAIDFEFGIKISHAQIYRAELPLSKFMRQYLRQMIELAETSRVGRR